MMKKPNILELAKQGNLKAIVTLATNVFNKSLSEKWI